MMGRLTTVVTYRLRQMRRAVTGAGWAQLAVAGIFLLLAAGVATGIFLFFSRSFGYLMAEPYAGPAIIKYTVELAFAFVFGIGVASFVISSRSFLFSSRETQFLLTMPMHPLRVFLYRFLAATAVSSWPVLLLALPATAALGVSGRAGVSYYVCALFVLVAFVLLIAIAGGLLSFLSALAFRRVSPTIGHAAEAALFLAVMVIGAGRLMNREIFTVLGADTAAAGEAALTRVADMFALMPTHPVAEIVSSSLIGVSAPAAVAGIMFLLFALTLQSLALTVLVCCAYLRLWQNHRETMFVARREDMIRVRRIARMPFPRVMRWGHGYLMEKDLLSFLRNAEETGRAGFLLVLLCLYILAMRGLAQMQAFEQTKMFALALGFVFAAVGYFALTFGIRFVFPSLSQEGKGAWVIWASPLHLHEIIFWKFVAWSVLIGLVMEGATWLTASLFGLPTTLSLFLMFAMACAVVSLVALTLGQGSLRPNFHDDNPDTVSTSPAGLLATGIGLAYLALIAHYVYHFSLSYMAGVHPDPVFGFGVIVVSAVLVLTYGVLARRSISNMEIV